MDEANRRFQPLFSIGIVQQLTQLTGRQIRYYEEQGLIDVPRSEGGHRLYSFHHIEQLFFIKELLEQGLNMAGIRKVFQSTTTQEEFVQTSGPLPAGIHEREKRIKTPQITSQELLERVRQQLINGERTHEVSLIQGELSRFFQ
ncbi:MerR family transcriptional regulator [Rubeoparvulum massiliense]|uniref:MerR family transcriptional regulator n=1 Tax=Rubeoparvulum massiliense TaxID=1631346 RepID=UPI00065DF9D0|nr:MerR family transcriptional regulator [Rubeoparvulum massiliense]